MQPQLQTGGKQSVFVGHEFREGMTFSLSRGSLRQHLRKSTKTSLLPIQQQKRLALCFLGMCTMWAFSLTSGVLSVNLRSFSRTCLRFPSQWFDRTGP